MFNAKYSDAQIDAEVATWLRNGTPSDRALNVERSRLLFRIDLNGVGPILALRTTPMSLSEDLQKSLRQRLVAREMWEEQHRRLLVQALDALSTAGQNPILMKGTALAYSHYPKPSMRVRGDSDILIEESDRHRAFLALEEAGFSRTMIPGEVGISEMVFQKSDLAGFIHDFDLHWRLSNSAALSRLFDHAELLERSVSLAQLGALGRRMGDIDALLFACVHRRIHLDLSQPMFVDGVGYDCPDCLSWLMDIQLLYQSLPECQRMDFVKRAQEKGIANLCARALRSSQDRLGLLIEKCDLYSLEAREPDWVEAYLGASYLRKHFINLRSQRGIWTKARYLSEVLFPNIAFIRRRFEHGRFDWLIILYLRRLIHGFRRITQRKQDTS